MSTNCLKIKDLEERLVCLKQKHNKLTEDLEKERSNMSSDDLGNYSSLITDRVIVEKQIEITKKRLQAQARIKSNIKKDSVGLGTCVKLKNHKKEIEVCIVSNNEAHPPSGQITIDSPIGKAIIGKKAGENVTIKLPAGRIQYTIAKIK